MTDFSDELDLCVSDCQGTLGESVSVQPRATGTPVFDPATGDDTIVAPPHPETASAVVSERTSQDLGLGGSRARVTEIEFRIAAGDLSFEPKVEDLVTYRNAAHPIASVGREAGDRVLVLTVRIAGD